MRQNETAGRGRAQFGHSAGHRWLLAGFVVLVGGVLPFVCWGSSADPAHPHLLPHFVFGAPVTHPHTGLTDPARATPADTPDAAGVARPATLLLALLGIALGAVWQWPSPRHWRGVRRPHARPARPLWLPVPTPPPR